MIKQVFDKALDFFLSEVSKDNRVEGVLVAGSYTRGELGPYSDLDIYLLLACDGENLEGWETREIDSVELEITKNTFQGYHSVLQKAKDIRDVIAPIAEGCILLDRESRFAEIKEQAQGVVRSLSQPIPPDGPTKLSMTRPLTFGYRKIGNAFMQQDWHVFDSEYGFILHLLPIQVLALSGRRIALRPLQLLKDHFPDISELLASCFENQTREEKWISFCALMKRVFAEFSLGKLPRPVVGHSD